MVILYWFDTGDFEIVDDDDITDGVEKIDVEMFDNDETADEIKIVDDDDDDDGKNVATDEVEIIDDDGDEVDDNAFSFESFVSKKLYNVGDANMPPATLSLVCFAIGLGKESVEISFLNGDSETSSLRFFPFLFFLRFTSGT